VGQLAILGAAGMAASFILGGLGFDIERRQQGEAARTQLLQAMQITSSRLANIQKKVQGTK